MKQQYREANLYQSEEPELFDVNYIAMLTILSVVLEVYGLNQNEQQSKDNYFILKYLDKAEEKLDKIESRMKKLERILERSVYNDR